MDISVIIPTHNPNPARLRATLGGLGRQSFPRDRWEIIVVDNGSIPALESSQLDAENLPALRVVREPNLGLPSARLRGIVERQGRLIIFVDDDNVLAPDYLAAAWTIFCDRPTFGAFGGNAYPRWEAGPPPGWTAPFHQFLALRNLGGEILHADGESFGPAFSPNGAGMCVRIEVALAYADHMRNSPQRRQLDRNGKNLGAHGDHDLAWESFPLGLEVAFIPSLTLEHIIPPSRLTRRYLGALLYGMSFSAVAFCADRGLPCDWRYLRWPRLRKARQYLLRRAWTRQGYVSWRHYCGTIDGVRSLSPLAGSRPA